MTAPVIAFYISGHGFGHAARVIEVINALAEIKPDVSLVIRTSTAKWLFDVTLKPRAEHHEVRCDVGVLQGDSLHIDAPRTMREAKRFYDELDAMADREAAFLRERGVQLVVGDMPPLAFVAAAKAGIPSVAMGNFTWDWIYEGYPDDIVVAPGLAEIIRHAHGLASLVVRLPMWGGFEGFHCPIIDVPFVARHSERNPEDVRAWLRIPDRHRVVLASFGGLGIAGLDLGPLAGMPGYTVVTTGHALKLNGGAPDAIRLLEDTSVYKAGFRYEDLVRAADVVVTKPGYGIIAECLANGTAMLYTSRGHFVEYDVMVGLMPEFLRCRFIGHDDLYGGLWQPHLHALLAQPAPPTHPATNGAPLAARLILGSGPECGISSKSWIHRTG